MPHRSVNFYPDLCIKCIIDVSVISSKDHNGNKYFLLYCAILVFFNVIISVLYIYIEFY